MIHLPSTSDAIHFTEADAPSRFGAKLEIPTPHYPYIHRGLNSYGPEVEACFFSPSDERQLELGGALLSSPAPSRQGSPALDRRQRMQPLTAINSSKNQDAVMGQTLKGEAISTADTKFLPSEDADKENSVSTHTNPTTLRRRVADADGDAGDES